MNLLEEASKGKVIFEGVDITDKKNDLFAMREKMGMVFQQFNLFLYDCDGKYHLVTYQDQR